MRGHVRKRGSSWTVVYDEGQDEHGKRRQRSKGGFATKRDATRFLTNTLSRLGDGSYAAPSKVTLADYLAGEWLPAVEGTLRPLSHDRYTRVVRLYVTPNIGNVRLQSLSAGHLNGLYAELERAGLSVSTRRLVHAVLGRALRDAERWGRVPRNVARMADPPTRGGSPASAWTPSEVRCFLDRVRGDRMFALWRLAATTGMRRGELAGLTWRCLDLEGARLHVEQQLVPTRGGVSFGPPKSNRSRRTVALDPETVEALRKHRDTQLLERDFASDAYQDRDLVFADELGGSIHPQRLTEWFGQHRKAAGIPSGTLHTLRHTAATLALTSGVPVHIVAARLGDDPKTVLSTYAHLMPQSDELAAERVAVAASAPRRSCWWRSRSSLTSWPSGP
jgi:integrase